MPKLRSFLSFLFDTDMKQTHPHDIHVADEPQLPDKYYYTRPNFVKLNSEVDFCDHNLRPIIVCNGGLPFNAGYAECINGGKSKHNEDQAAVGNFHLCIGESSAQARRIPVTYFAIFDGHGGTGAALMASHLLIDHIQEKLQDIRCDLLRMLNGGENESFLFEITIDDLISGALEAAFCSLDEQILRELSTFDISGGCVAIVILVLLGKVFVASTGDCRAVLCLGDEVKPLNKEATPSNEINRLQLVTLSGTYKEVFSNEISNTVFIRRIVRSDLEKKVLCKEPNKSYWSYKVVTKDDLSFPFIYGKDKGCRLMETIGVSRSLGDHKLTASFSRKIKLKPFLIPNPEVQVFDLKPTPAAHDDFIIMGCDGLWDVISNKEARDIVRTSTANITEDYRYVAAAQQLVHEARGDNLENVWKRTTGRLASFDDISVFVIPIEPMLNTLDCPVRK